MKLKAVVKVIEDEQKGVSRRSGDEWKMRNVLLEWVEEKSADAKLTNRLRAHLFRSMCEEWDKAHILAGQTIEAEVSFSTSTTRNGFVFNEARIESFALV